MTSDLGMTRSASGSSTAGASSTQPGSGAAGLTNAPGGWSTPGGAQAADSEASPYLPSLENRLPIRPGRDGGVVRALWDRGLVFAGMVTGYVVFLAFWIIILVSSELDDEAQRNVRDTLLDAVQDQAPALGVVFVVSTAGLFALIGRGVGRYILGARRMAADVRLMTNVNPAHRLWLTGPPEMKELGADINALGEVRRRAVEEVAAYVSATQAALTEERNRLAVLMAELTVPVIVANTEGRILLYNAAARELVADEAALGLGRSLFGVVERDVVLHALAQLRQRPRPVQVATAQPDGRMLRARVAGVRDDEGGLTGIVLVLEDLTSAVKATQRHDAFLRELSRATRSSVANIRAAIETVLDYPDMAAEDRSQFLSIVAEEATRLGEQTQSWFDGSASGARKAWLPADMPAADLLIVLAGELARAGYDADILVAADAVAPESSWLKVDSHALSRAVVHLAGLVVQDCGAMHLELAYDERRGHAAIDLRWSGEPVGAGMFGRWLGAPAGPEGSPSLHDVVDHHGGEIWAAVGDDDVPYVRLMLPLADNINEIPEDADLPESRPEFYDFDLFNHADATADLRERRLEDLTFTVLDTETTGLDPNSDEIISIGAVRCINGRLLQGETFERLVDPGRRVPDASIAIHGITNDMVRGQPTIDQVLPAFRRFSEDTVLVGHNVGFDMRFLKNKEGATGVRFDQPVLDTLLLDAVLHPDHQDHTLEAIAERIGVSVLGRHTALGDALVTGEIFLGMIRLLAEHGITTLGAAIEASRATYMSRVDRHYQD